MVSYSETKKLAELLSAKLNNSVDDCMDLAQYLVSEGVRVPPVKNGETIYYIQNGKTFEDTAIVKASVETYFLGRTEMEFDFSTYGKVFFSDKAKATEALKLQNNGDL